MKIYYESLLNSVKRHTYKLEKQSLFVNTPWVLVDQDNEEQKFIFKRNGELILSKNGVVTKGNWEYLPEANSLIIEQSSGTILLNETYLDGNVLILKIDGTANSYYPLANSNEIPDLNIPKYLLGKKLEKEDFGIVKLDADTDLLIPKSSADAKYGLYYNMKGKPVYTTSDSYELTSKNDSQYYLISDQTKYIHVKNGVIGVSSNYTKYSDNHLTEYQILDGLKSFRFDENVGHTLLRNKQLYPNQKGVFFQGGYGVDTDENSKIIKCYIENKFKIKGGQALKIRGQKRDEIHKNDIILEPRSIPNGKYKLKNQFRSFFCEENIIIKTGFSLF